MNTLQTLSLLGYMAAVLYFVTHVNCLMRATVTCVTIAVPIDSRCWEVIQSIPTQRRWKSTDCSATQTQFIV